MMMRTQKVLTFCAGSEDEALFCQPEVEGATLFPLHRRDWADMGCPQTITVTIEPGDTLNETPQ